MRQIQLRDEKNSEYLQLSEVAGGYIDITPISEDDIDIRQNLVEFIDKQDRITLGMLFDFLDLSSVFRREDLISTIKEMEDSPL